MRSLTRRERGLEAYWDEGEGSKLKNKVQLIALQTRPIDERPAFLMLTYDFDNWEDCKATLAKHSQDAL